MFLPHVSGASVRVLSKYERFCNAVLSRVYRTVHCLAQKKILETMFVYRSHPSNKINYPNLSSTVGDKKYSFHSIYIVMK